MWKQHCKLFLWIPYLIGPFGMSNNVNLNCATYSPMVKQKCNTNFECYDHKKKTKMVENSAEEEK